MWGASLSPGSHFIKHLVCTLSAHFPWRSHRFFHFHAGFSFLSPPFYRPSPRQWRACSLAAASVSSPAVPPYHSVLIRCRKDIADMLSEALLSFGASSVSMDEHDDYENSDEVSICSIFTGHGDVKICISHAADSIGLEEIPSFEFLKYNPYDWIKRTQESFDPVEVTKGLWVVPEWKTPPDVQATNITINPGLAFGTGEHATTKLCLLLLHESVTGGELFLDYGTGSGILSIAALKLGAAVSVAVDIDPQAIRAARQNADLNNIGPEKLKLHLIPEKDSVSSADARANGRSESQNSIGIFTDKDKYDIVIANILLNPLLDLADSIVSHAKAGATVGLSGIIRDQVPCVIDRYSPFLDDISVSEMEDWACVRGTKKRNSCSN